MHIHYLEDEEGTVTAGRLSVMLGGKRIDAGLGETLFLPRGVPHRWWNEGDEPLAFEGITYPVAGLDAYLQAIFEIVNAGPPGRPSVFYMAHLALRHRRTQVVLFMPPLLQHILFPFVVAIGTVLGRYRGTAWPGCPARCTGVPPLRGGEEIPSSLRGSGAAEAIP